MQHAKVETDLPVPPAQSSGLAIEMQGLHKSFKELEVLRGVDLEVARGSIFALLGSNGAGKTTLVKILSTLRTLGSPASTALMSQRSRRRSASRSAWRDSSRRSTTYSADGRTSC